MVVCLCYQNIALWIFPHLTNYTVNSLKLFAYVHLLREWCVLSFYELFEWVDMLCWLNDVVNVLSLLIHSALACLFLLVARVHSTCLRAAWRLLSRLSFLRSSTNVLLLHLGHQLPNPPGALCRADWTHLKAMTHSLEVIAVDHRRPRKMIRSPILPNLVLAGWVSMAVH